MSNLAMRVLVVERPLAVMALTFVEPDKPFFAFAIIDDHGEGKSKVAASAYGKTGADARNRLITHPHQTPIELRPPEPEKPKRVVRKKTTT